MKKLITSFIACFGLFGSVQAATYQAVVLEKSSITFKFKQMGVTADGRFRKFSAQIGVDTDKPAEAKGAITSDAAEREKEKLREKRSFLRQGLTVEGEEKD